MTLREKVLEGGFYLLARRGLGLAMSFVGIMVLTRLIGPKNYGLYVTAFGFVDYISSLAVLGINVYLIRKEKEPDLQEYHQAYSLMLITGLGGIVLGVAICPILLYWYHNSDFILPLLVLLLTLPMGTMTNPAMASLERAINNPTGQHT